MYRVYMRRVGMMLLTDGWLISVNEIEQARDLRQSIRVEENRETVSTCGNGSYPPPKDMFRKDQTRRTLSADWA